MHIIDRRLNPGSKSLENRQRFLRRAKALVQGAVKKSSEDRDIRDVLEGGEVSIPLDGMNEPRFHREGHDPICLCRRTRIRLAHEASLNCRSSKKGRFAPPVHIIKLTK